MPPSPRTGERSGARYLLAPSITPPAGWRLTDDDLRQMILDLAEQEPVTNRLVRERLALDRVEALKVLRELVDEGELVMQGKRRGTEYVRRDHAEGDRR